MSSKDAAFDVDECIQRLLSFTPGKTGHRLSASELLAACEQCKTILMAQPVLLELAAPIRVLGDVHGQYSDLLRLFGPPPLSAGTTAATAGSPSAAARRVWVNWGACAEFGGLPPESNYLFMGDYVDRGSHGYEYSPAHPARSFVGVER